MARKKLLRSSRHPYHVTIRSNNKEWFYIPIATTWSIFTSMLNRTAEKYSLEPHAFVLMSNHIHLLLSTPNCNLDAALRYLFTEMSRRIQWKAGRINHICGARYKWSWLPGAIETSYAYKYVLRNPVRAGICDRVEAYPYSSLFGLLGDSWEVPMVESYPDFRALPSASEERLRWLNSPSPKELEELIRLALRRKSFAFSRDSKIQLRVKKLEANYLNFVV